MPRIKVALQLPLLFFLLSFYSASKAITQDNSYQEKFDQGFWQIKGGAGLAFTGPILKGSTFSTKTINTGRTISNTLEEESKKASVSNYISLQKSFVFNNEPLYALSFGPTFYFEQISSTGQGSTPNYPNIYTYSFTNKQIAVVLEAQWTPVLLWQSFAPYLVLGLGLNSSNNSFNTIPDPTASPNIPPPNSLKSNQYSLVADLGFGAEFMFTKSFGMDFRYVYLYNFGSKITGLSATPSTLPFKSNTHNILLGIVWRFGFTN